MYLMMVALLILSDTAQLGPIEATPPIVSPKAKKPFILPHLQQTYDSLLLLLF